MQSNQGLLDKLKAKLDRSGASGRRRSGSRNGLTSIEDDNTSGALVSVNVYDMLWLNVYTDSLGIGVYHTGVVVYDTEYCYGGHPLSYSGIFAMVPQDTETLGPNYSFKTTIELGRTDFTEADVTLILEGMGPQYRGDQYHLLHRNCNHFSNALVQILCGSSLPKWINRLAGVGAKLPFVERSIPKIWLTPRPLYESDNPEEHALPSIDIGTHSCPVLVSDNLHRHRASDVTSNPDALCSSSSCQSSITPQRRPHSTTNTPRSISSSGSSPTSSLSLSKRVRNKVYSSCRRASMQSRPEEIVTVCPVSSSMTRRLSMQPGDSIHDVNDNKTNMLTDNRINRNGPPFNKDAWSGKYREPGVLSRLTNPFVSFLAPRRPSSVYLYPEESRMSSRLSATCTPISDQEEMNLFAVADGQFTNIMNARSPRRIPSDSKVSVDNTRPKSMCRLSDSSLDDKICSTSDCTGLLSTGLFNRLHVLCGGGSDSRVRDSPGRRPGEHDMSNGF